MLLQISLLLYLFHDNQQCIA